MRSTIELAEFPSEPMLSGIRNRILQALAGFMPGNQTLRPRLHRWRGVAIGKNVRIGSGVVIETAFPGWVSIGNGVQIGLRAMIIAHTHSVVPPVSRGGGKGSYVSVRIEDEVYIGPGAIVLPRVTLGRGAVVTAGSVVSASVAPLTMVQGNPARPVAHCGVPLTASTPLKEFFRQLKPIHRSDSGDQTLEGGNVTISRR
jgi:acetyltransferase-like isoleucine patch superfamily enzyme